MSDQPIGTPGDAGDMRDKAAQSVGGYRGERAQDRSADDPDLRRKVDTVDGPVEVEDSSGSEHVEAEREAGLARRRQRATPKAKPELKRRMAPARAAAPAEPRPDGAASRLGLGLVAAAGIGAAAYFARAVWKHPSA